MKLEESYNELQFQENYFHEINRIIAPKFEYNLKGEISGIELPLYFEKSERNILLSYLWKIKRNREFILKYYSEVEKKINQLSIEIEKELER